MCKLCNELCKSITEKCLKKLTWYHFAAVILCPDFFDHPGLTDYEAVLDRVRLDLRGMIATIGDSENMKQPPVKKPKFVLCDSDSESADAEAETMDSTAATGDDCTDELDKYMNQVINVYSN